jgi:tripartite-type tricarboxylate transporter receptor subunit TctC
MEVNRSFPAKTIPEFIAYAKARPGMVLMASAGIGSGPHVTGELFQMMTGLSMVHVPYRGEGPALADLIGGQVQVMFGVMASSIPYVRSGALRPLGVTTQTRSAALPDVPAISEFVPGYEASSVYGLGAPARTPGAIIETLNGAANAALADPRVKARFADFGGTPLPGTPADFGRLLAAETAKWHQVVKTAGIKLE